MAEPRNYFISPHADKEYAQMLTQPKRHEDSLFMPWSPYQSEV